MLTVAAGAAGQEGLFGPGGDRSAPGTGARWGAAWRKGPE